MWFLEWVQYVYANEKFLCASLSLATVALLLFATCAYILRSSGVFVGFAAIVGGCVGGEVAYGKVGLRSGIIGLSALLAFIGILYLLLFLILFIRKKTEERKRRRAEISRKVFYTLPERENEYVRTRLNTTLQCEETNLDTDVDIPKELKRPIKLGYARQLLANVKSVALSPAERLQTEEMSKTLSMYFAKERWTAEDIRAVNEVCATLLKLCAKYAV